MYHPTENPFSRNWFLAPTPLRTSSRDQPRPALVGEIAVRPFHEYADAVAEAGEIHDVEEQPEPPREAAGDVEAAEVRDCAVAPDRREVALVSVMKGEAFALLEVSAD